MSIKVPILEKIVQNDSTVYYFSESNNDLLKQLTSKTKRRVPSKFVCLNLPNWQNNSGTARQLFLSPADFGTSPLITDPNDLIPGLMQNYMENLVAYSKIDEVFEPQLTEYAFWKMTKLLGSSKFQLDGSDPDGRYIDDWGDNHKLVVYVGDINVMNHVQYKSEEYSELYLHIPHDAKAIDTIHWKTNPNSLSTVTTIPLTPPGDLYSQGLATSTTPIKKAIYDKNPAGSAYTTSYDFSDPQDVLSLDFTNFTTVAEDFQYNCILLYYDTYDVNEAGNAINKTQKLGGIMFVNEFEQQGITGTWIIDPFKKTLNSNLVTGNAIVHRLNSRFFYGNNMSEIQTIVNQYNTVSMELYMDALKQMVELNTKSIDVLNQLDEIKTKFSNINQLNLQSTTILGLQQQIQSLQNEINSITSGSTQATQITTQQLLSAFDVLVQQLQLFNSGNSQTGTFNNKFVFGASGALLSNFDIFYVEAGLGTNLSIVKYANESLLSNFKYRTYFRTPFDLKVFKFDDSGTNKLKFEFNALPGYTNIIGYSYNQTTDSVVTNTLPAANTSVLEFAVTSEQTQTAFVYDTSDSTFKFITINQIRDEKMLTCIVIAVFYIPTETEFDASKIDLFVPSKQQSVNYDLNDFSINDGKLKAFNDSAYAKLKQHTVKILNNITISVAAATVSTANDTLRITVGQSVTTLSLFDGSTITAYTQPSITDDIDVPFATSSAAVSEMIVLFNTSTNAYLIKTIAQFLIDGGLNSSLAVIGTILVPQYSDFLASGNTTAYRNIASKS